MIAIVGVVLAVSVIAACVGQIYYCKRPLENYDSSESTIGDETPMVHIKISQPHQDQSLNDTFSDTGDSRRCSIDSNNIKEMKQVVKEAEPVSSEETQIVRVKPPSKSHRISTRIWSRALRRQLESITDSSLETCCGTTKVVQAQVEANPTASPSISQEASEVLESKVSSRDYRNSCEVVLDQSYLRVEKGRKISSVVKKLRNLKRSLICSRTEKSMVFKDYETDETQRLNLPVPPLNQRSPMERSTAFQNNRLDNVSTSTRISANVSDMRRQNAEKSKKRDNSDENDETPKQPENDSRSNKKELSELVSLIKRQSVNGKSVCDVRISGLTMNQSELLDLFEATRCKTQSTSIVTTEEASIISIKFHRQGNSSSRVHIKDSSFFEDSLKRIYKSLPEKFEGLSPFNVFRSQDQSRTSNRMNPTIQISDHSNMNRSRNETSYLSVPKIRSKTVADNAVFNRGRSISRRYNNYNTSRSFRDR